MQYSFRYRKKKKQKIIEDEENEEETVEETNLQHKVHTQQIDELAILSSTDRWCPQQQPRVDSNWSNF